MGSQQAIFPVPRGRGEIRVEAPTALLSAATMQSHCVQCQVGRFPSCFIVSAAPARAVPIEATAKTTCGLQRCSTAGSSSAPCSLLWYKVAHKPSQVFSCATQESRTHVQSSQWGNLQLQIHSIHNRQNREDCTDKRQRNYPRCHGICWSCS